MVLAKYTTKQLINAGEPLDSLIVPFSATKQDFLPILQIRRNMFYVTIVRSHGAVHALEKLIKRLPKNVCECSSSIDKLSQINDHLSFVDEKNESFIVQFI